MSSACTPVLVGVAITVLEIFLFSKTAKFLFRGMDYSPWSLKNLINRNQLKKFMQVGIDVHACTSILAGVTPPVSDILIVFIIDYIKFRSCEITVSVISANKNQCNY